MVELVKLWDVLKKNLIRFERRHSIRLLSDEISEPIYIIISRETLLFVFRKKEEYVGCQCEFTKSDDTTTLISNQAEGYAKMKK